jgi:DNA-binding CsgD family transcriptional regulator
VAVVAKPHEVVAGSKAALCVLQSWDGNGPLSHKLPRGPITLPGPIRKWYSGRDAGTSSLHPRWTIRLTHLKPPHRQPRASHFLIHLSEKTITYPQRSWHTLTTVERELVRGIMEGRSNPQIAQARGVSPATVKNQFSRLLGKLQLPNRTTLAVCFRDAVMRESHSDEAA